MPANPKPPKPIRDRQYRERAQRMPCAVPGCPEHGMNGNVVLAHIRFEGSGGMGMKPSDDESFYLCATHHDELDGRRPRDAWSAAAWIVRNIVIPERKAAYHRWKVGTGR